MTGGKAAIIHHWLTLILPLAKWPHRTPPTIYLSDWLSICQLNVLYSNCEDWNPKSSPLRSFCCHVDQSIRPVFFFLDNWIMEIRVSGCSCHYAHRDFLLHTKPHCSSAVDRLPCASRGQQGDDITSKGQISWGTKQEGGRGIEKFLENPHSSLNQRNQMQVNTHLLPLIRYLLESLSLSHTHLFIPSRVCCEIQYLSVSGLWLFYTLMTL